MLNVGCWARTVRELMRSVLPWTWTAFPVALAAGFLLFSSKASTYYENIPFKARVTGAVSLASWVVIVATGRWIGFTT